MVFAQELRRAVAFGGWKPKLRGTRCGDRKRKPGGFDFAKKAGTIPPRKGGGCAGDTDIDSGRANKAENRDSDAGKNGGYCAVDAGAD